MRLKALLKNYAARWGVPAQVALQNYMFERFLERLSRSPYRDHFVIKGGMLVSHLMGLATRTTMDLDATLRRMPLTGEAVLQAVNTIASIDLGDGTVFESIGMEPIRKDDVYGGFRVRLDALKQSFALHEQWKVYSAKFPYARGISLESTLEAVRGLMAGWTP